MTDLTPRFQALLRQPMTAAQKFWVCMTTGFLVIFLSYVHFSFGQAFEFYIFFGFPVVMMTWFVGPCAGLGLSGFAIFCWFIVDGLVLGQMSSVLITNSALRFLNFAAEVWVIQILRTTLTREMVRARRDPLTHLPNRREFFERGQQMVSLARRHAAPLTAVFVDLDHFKEVNDTLGHDVGDVLLQRVATGMSEAVRASDLIGRLGGDEFALLLPDLSADAAITMVERLRQHLLDIMAESKWSVTFSIGVASYDQPPDTLLRVIGQADQLMYQVKTSGRNRILHKAFAMR